MRPRIKEDEQSTIMVFRVPYSVKSYTMQKYGKRLPDMFRLWLSKIETQIVYTPENICRCNHKLKESYVFCPACGQTLEFRPMPEFDKPEYDSENGE